MKEYNYAFRRTFSSHLSVSFEHDDAGRGWDAGITESIRNAPLMSANNATYGVDTVLAMLLNRPGSEHPLRRSDLEKQFRKIGGRFCSRRSRWGWSSGPPISAP